MSRDWQPFREPFRVTIRRTGLIALAVGAAVAGFRGWPAVWPVATLLALWPALGGHWVELLFLNVLRPRLPDGRPAQAVARVAMWFGGGAGLYLGMRLTAGALAAFQPAHWPDWWVGGLAFIVLELAVHLALQLRGRDSFYNGRG